jgi:hypothetical protein
MMTVARSDEEIDRAVEAFENFDPSEATLVDVSDLRAIAEAADAVRRDEAYLVERVAIARAHGRSWTMIGHVMGVSRQAARQRFAGKIDA